MTGENDIVLIYFEDQPLSYARIEEILPDSKPNWYHVRLLLLQFPLQVVTWILRDVYINGDEFTMDGKRIRLERIVAPQPAQTPSGTQRRKNRAEAASRGQSDIAEGFEKKLIRLSAVFDASNPAAGRAVKSCPANRLNEQNSTENQNRPVCLAQNRHSGMLPDLVHEQSGSRVLLRHQSLQPTGCAGSGRSGHGSHHRFLVQGFRSISRGGDRRRIAEKRVRPLFQLHGQLRVAAAGTTGPAAGKPPGSTRSAESPVRTAIDQLAFRSALFLSENRRIGRRQPGRFFGHRPKCASRRGHAVHNELHGPLSQDTASTGSRSGVFLCRPLAGRKSGHSFETGNPLAATADRSVHLL